MIRSLFYGVSAAIIALAAVVVPMPLVEFAPGAATEIPPLIEIEDTETYPIKGEVSLLTVRLAQPSLAEAIAAWASPNRELQQRNSVIPSGVDRNRFFELQQRQFETAFELAAAVGLEAAGYEVEVNDVPVVFSVLPEGPAGDVLESGDVILSAQGEPVGSAERLIEQLQDVEPGEEIELRIRRGGEELTVTVTAGPVPGLDRPAGLGILLETVGGDIDLPFPVELQDTDIGGPSAGLMTALTVYDLVTEEDLVRGRSIAGTGSIDASGTVGAIGGIQEKVVAADRADADIILVPASQRAEIDFVPDSLEVIPVATFDAALEALSS